MLLLLLSLLPLVHLQDIISTIAGTGTTSINIGDGGPATDATLDLPYGVALDPTGDVYIADQVNQVVRKITVSNGMIKSIAGMHYIVGSAGDGGAATSAELRYPFGVALDTAGIPI